MSDQWAREQANYQIGKEALFRAMRSLFAGEYIPVQIEVSMLQMAPDQAMLIVKGSKIHVDAARRIIGIALSVVADADTSPAPPGGGGGGGGKS